MHGRGKAGSEKVAGAGEGGDEDAGLKGWLSLSLAGGGEQGGEGGAEGGMRRSGGLEALALSHRGVARSDDGQPREGLLRMACFRKVWRCAFVAA